MSNNITSIKEMLQSIQVRDMSIEEGIVVRQSPLLIKLVNDNLLLNKNIMTIPVSLTDYEVSCDIMSGDGSIVMGNAEQKDFSLTNGRIKIYNSLKKNDKVLLLSYNGGKKYYVLDREG